MVTGTHEDIKLEVIEIHEDIKGVDEIFETLRNTLEKSETRDDDITQRELAFLISILPDVAKTGNAYLVAQASIVANSLLAKHKNLILAYKVNRRILEAINQQLYPKRHYVLQMVGPVRAVLSGMFFFVSISILFNEKIDSLLIETQGFFPDKASASKVAIVSAIGGIVSIVTRLPKFSGMLHANLTELFFTGLFKPFIGSVFGLFICALIGSEFLPINFTGTNPELFFLVIAFFAGFSERFTKDMVGRAEDTLISNDKSEAPKRPNSND